MVYKEKSKQCERERRERSDERGFAGKKGSLWIIVTN